MAYFQPQTHMREVQVVPKYTALLFIDIQNYNCHRGGAIYRHYTPEQLEGPEFQYFFARIEEISGNWQRVQQLARQCGIEVMYTVIQSLTKDGRDRGLDYKISGFHVPPGSWDSKVLDAVKPIGDEIVIPKTSSSVFNSTNIDYLLRSLDKRFLIICGCVTEQCVAHAVKDACDLGYYVTLLPDCCATYSQQRHDNVLASVAGYCRMRNVAELAEELKVYKVLKPGKTTSTPASTPKPTCKTERPPEPPGEVDDSGATQSASKKERKSYFEYAKHSWETEEEFRLPNGQTWVEVPVKGDPDLGERGVVFCKLCRQYGKNNLLAKGYRAGKRSALREHMATRDHRELVDAVISGQAPMPFSTPHAPDLPGTSSYLPSNSGPDTEMHSISPAAPTSMHQVAPPPLAPPVEQELGIALASPDSIAALQQHPMLPQYGEDSHGIGTGVEHGEGSHGAGLLD